MLNNLEHTIPSLGTSNRKDDDTRSSEADKMSPVDEKVEIPPVDTVSLSRKNSYSSGNLTIGDELLGQSDLDPVYFAKAHLLSQAYAEIGMGKYQWGLFVAAGFGWFSDSVWPLAASLILTPVVNEFNMNPPFLSLASNIGLLVGAGFWSIGCDIIGRRWSFNITLLISGVFGLAAGGSPNFVTLAALYAVVGVGCGGNMPVDSAVFLEFIPASHQYLLTILSIWWTAGALICSLVAWPLIANFSCETAEGCTKSENMGWRYLIFTLAGIVFVMWALRAFVFRLHESPRYLVSRGEDEKAISVLQTIARVNGGHCSLTVEQLRAAGASAVTSTEALKEIDRKKGTIAYTKAVINETLGHVKALFASRKMAWSTSLLIFLWGNLGLASTLYNSFLPFLLAHKGAVFGDSSLNITYRNTFIITAIGVPSAFLAGWLVNLPYIGRKGSLTLSCVLTAIMLFGTTTARSSNALLAWNCVYTFFINIMYGVLYAITPEIFPAKDRGTGNGLTSITKQVFSVLAPIIALAVNINTSVPVFISGALIIVSGFVALLLPYEPRGKSST